MGSLSTLQPHICPACGAPLPEGSRRCEHCGVWFETTPEKKDPASSVRSMGQIILPRLSTGAGEFGFEGKPPLVLGMIMACIIYILGWFLEDTQYWLAPASIAAWGALMPIWLGLAAFLWRTPRPVWMVGLIVGLALFAAHIAIVWLIRRDINDDLVGIAAIYAGMAFAGWSLGRWMRALLRQKRVQSE